jgi:diguanylate cyclase (GGDEF)-like protein
MLDDGAGAGHRNDHHRTSAKTARHVGMPIRIAAAGLVVVLLVLTVFSVTVAVTNARAAERAERSAVASEAFGAALESLLMQEAAAAEVVVAQDDEESRGEYAVAESSTRRALDALYRSAESDQFPPIEVLLRLHTGYGRAVQRLFVVAARSPSMGSSFEVPEDALVDSYFDRLSAALRAEGRERSQDAQEAVSTIGRAQQFLLVVTPLSFGVGMALLLVLVVVLGRSRREVLVQAADNRHQSLHDALTGLPNRVLLRQRCEAALDQAARTGTPMALLLIDLDRFKEINDTLGHHHGDLVLRELAPILLRSVRSTDTVSRLGGDEFAIVLSQVDGVTGALEVARKVRSALGHSINVGGIALDVDASVGVVLSGEHGDDVETLLQHVDIAMYRAKGRNLGVCLYEATLNEHSLEQLGLLGELRRALDNDELVLLFQPQISLAGRDFWGAEALLRWNHPDRGLLGAGAFIPAAEHTALIRPLTQWVLNAALAECHRWREQGKTLRLAVNVSARNLLDADFADNVMGLLETWQLPASCVLLEVTESAIILEPERAVAVLSRFAEVGIELAIDDFGAGYTSLAQLRTLPIQEIKIDQALVAEIAVSVNDALIVRAVIDLAQGLGLRTVAEGVEDEATLEVLRMMGCDIAQGFHIARPMPAADLIRWAPKRDALGSASATTLALPTAPLPG